MDRGGRRCDRVEAFVFFLPYLPRVVMCFPHFLQFVFVFLLFLTLVHRGLVGWMVGLFFYFAYYFS